MNEKSGVWAMKTKKKTQKLVLAGVLAAVIAVLAQVVFPIGPVPFSMAVFAVFLTGALLPPSYAAGCVFSYLVLGAVGLPVFAGFKGGVQVLAGPTGGFLLGYFALALSVSFASKLTNSCALRLVSALSGLAICYALGAVWFSFVTQNSILVALRLCVWPFVLPDIAKATLALLLAKKIEERYKAGRVAV